MNPKIRWGILGCGKIAAKFASDLSLVKDAELAAVASRDEARCESFREKFKATSAYTSYTDMLKSSDVDVVYIATPHGLHHEHTLLCLSHGKAVLCEKAFGLNRRQVEEMIAASKKNKVFLMEAFWTKFLPQYEKVVALIEAGTIGEIKMIQADFGFRAPAPHAQRLYDPDLGGGALLDIGLYPVFLAQALLGKPTDIQALMSPYPSGVDEQSVMVMKFRNDALAVLSSTFAADTPVEAWIAGTLGRIHIRNRFHNATGEVELVLGKNSPVRIDVDREVGYGYQFEARHVGDCLRKGLIESPVMRHQHSLDLMETLDRVRDICNIRYAADR